MDPHQPCRFCMVKSAFHIFKGGSSDFAKKIHYTIGVKVCETDRLVNLCSECKGHIDSFHSFKKMCEKSEIENNGIPKLEPQVRLTKLPDPGSLKDEKIVIKQEAPDIDNEICSSTTATPPLPSSKEVPKFAPPVSTPSSLMPPVSTPSGSMPAGSPCAMPYPMPPFMMPASGIPPPPSLTDTSASGTAQTWPGFMPNGMPGMPGMMMSFYTFNNGQWTLTHGQLPSMLPCGPTVYSPVQYPVPPTTTSPVTSADTSADTSAATSATTSATASAAPSDITPPLRISSVTSTACAVKVEPLEDAETAPPQSTETPLVKVKTEVLDEDEVKDSKNLKQGPVDKEDDGKNAGDQNNDQLSDQEFTFADDLLRGIDTDRESDCDNQEDSSSKTQALDDTSSAANSSKKTSDDGLTSKPGANDLAVTNGVKRGTNTSRRGRKRKGSSGGTPIRRNRRGDQSADSDAQEDKDAKSVAGTRLTRSSTRPQPQKRQRLVYSSDDGDFDPDDPDDPEDPDFSLKKAMVYEKEDSSEDEDSPNLPPASIPVKLPTPVVKVPTPIVKLPTSTVKELTPTDKESNPPVKASPASTVTVKPLVSASPNAPPMQCRFCVRTFRNEQYLKCHEETHNIVKEFSCIKCTNSYRTKSELERHEEEKHENETWECKPCLAAFAQLKTWRSHVKSHRDAPTRICPFCQQTYKLLSAYERHLDHCQLRRCSRTNMGGNGKPSQGSEDSTDSNTDEKIHKCVVCCNKFVSPEVLMEHMKTHQRSKGPPYECRHCKQEFPQKGDLICHQAFAHRPVAVSEPVLKPPKKQPKCDICDEVFVSTGEAICHQVLHHKK